MSFRNGCGSHSTIPNVGWVNTPAKVILLMHAYQGHRALTHNQMSRIKNMIALISAEQSQIFNEKREEGYGKSVLVRLSCTLWYIGSYV